MRRFFFVALAGLTPLVACGGGGDESGPHAGTGGFITGTTASSSSSSGAGSAGGAGGVSSSSSGLGGGAASSSSSGTGGAGGGGGSKIEHVIVIVQENHTFDAYFGSYCTAPAGSSPSCKTGPACCEAAPKKEPGGASPVVLDDGENAGYDPTHQQSCELEEMNGGAMDRYVKGASCSDARNFAVAPASAVPEYHAWAAKYALADRYFQPIVGQSSSNDMYFAVAQYAFTDNAYKPGTNGCGCNLPGTNHQYTGVTTIADLLTQAGSSFAFYIEGYKSMLDAVLCPLPPADCPAHIPTSPCDYDPSDVPFQYYSQLADDPATMKDLGDFGAAVQSGKLPAVSFVKGVGYHNEHPGYGTTISQGIAFVSGIVDEVLASPLADSTLILLTWDEGGGFFDHVTPPPTSAVDQKDYGTRVPLLAIGRFARPNEVSHVVMEHSSIVKFLEWNFVHATGGLGGRDATVANIGSLLDPAEVGVAVPEN